MDRRENLKLLIAGSLGSGMLISACKPGEEPTKEILKPYLPDYARDEAEIKRLEEIYEDTFFTEDEVAKLNVLVDMIIPADESSPSAKDVGTVTFLEFIMKDQPENQTLMRGGLMWLDLKGQDTYQKNFLELDALQQKLVIDQIAYPDSATPELEFAVSFFNMLRNLTLTGYFTSEAGVKYLGYVGNTPNVWGGVPEDVLQKHGLAYDEKYKDIYLNPENRNDVASWDENGNLV
jgi:hypothetical protein